MGSVVSLLPAIDVISVVALYILRFVKGRTLNDAVKANKKA